MLALTECRRNEVGVAACATSNAVFDWVSLDAPIPSAKQGKKYKGAVNEDQSNPLIEEALTLRTSLFRKPADYFDPFASPILFFRTPGIDTPSPPTLAPTNKGDDWEELSRMSREDFFREQMGLSAMSSSQEEPQAPEPEQPAVAKRKASLTYPSRLSNLRPGVFRCEASATLGLQSQTEEFAKYLRRSFARQAQQAAGSPSFGRKLLEEHEREELEGEEKAAREVMEREADARALLQIGRQRGLWDGSEGGRARVREVGRWISGALEG